MLIGSITWAGSAILVVDSGTMNFQALKKDLALLMISALMLFFEVLLIRWLSAEIRIFAYFHNLVLLFCFLGIGLGCLLSEKKVYFLFSFAIIAVFTIALSLKDSLGIFSLQNISKYLSLDKDFVIWGNTKSTGWSTDLVWFSLGVLQLLISLSLLSMFFVPFGQMLARLLSRYESPLRGYGVNLLGSLAGVWLFYAISTLSLPPSVWFAVGGLLSLPFLLRKKYHLIGAVLLLALSIMIMYEPHTPENWTTWSPYQKLTVFPLRFIKKDGTKVEYGHFVQVNSVGYMFLSNYRPEYQKRYPELFPPGEVEYDHYNLAYQFVPNPQDVLVVGSGGGNDVAGALRNGARKITAVEIDPVIIKIGKQLHPESPYSNPRVQIVNDDARSFFKKTNQRFDLIIFGLLDSHTLSSSYSNVRLDNYVYTIESLREAKGLLKPDGLLLLIFEVYDDFIGARFARMLSQVFGYPPVVLEVRSGYRGWGGVCYLTGNMERIQAALDKDPRLVKLASNRSAKLSQWLKGDIRQTTDDWPYLYLKEKRIPKLYFVIFALLILVSYAGIKKASGSLRQLDWKFFFMGAGFLLLEVQNISRAALLFGSTWVVNTIVISGILVVILAANFISMKWKNLPMQWMYAALILSLLINYLVPIDIFSSLDPVTKGVSFGIFMSCPIFFAGIVFSTIFSIAVDRPGALASNLFGAMVGGMSECLSFAFGIKTLLIVAACFYIFSFVTGRKYWIQTKPE